jgi:hypothetical protein
LQILSQRVGRSVGPIWLTTNFNLYPPITNHGMRYSWLEILTTFLTNSPFFIDWQAETEVTDPQVAADLKKKRTFRTFSYRGVELEKLLDLPNDDVSISYILDEFPRRSWYGSFVSLSILSMPVPVVVSKEVSNAVLWVSSKSCVWRKRQLHQTKSLRS